MIIIGCDFHTRYQQIAMMDDSTGELVERVGETFSEPTPLLKPQSKPSDTPSPFARSR
jgi:hypothetical protein